MKYRHIGITSDSSFLNLAETTRLTCERLALVKNIYIFSKKTDESSVILGHFIYCIITAVSSDRRGISISEISKPVFSNRLSFDRNVKRYLVESRRTARVERMGRGISACVERVPEKRGGSKISASGIQRSHVRAATEAHMSHTQPRAFLLSPR